MSDTHRIAYVPPAPIVRHHCEPEDQDLPVDSVVQCNICKQYWYCYPHTIWCRDEAGRKGYKAVKRWGRVTKWNWIIWWRVSKGLA